LFNKLVKAHTKQEIEHIKHKHLRYVDKKVLKYLNTLDNEEVYPGARCKLGGRILMYQRSASLAVESMIGLPNQLMQEQQWMLCHLQGYC
jgi:hypothetical protein